MVSRGALQPQPFWESLKGGLTCVERDLVNRRHAESGEHRNGNGANCMGMWTALSVGTRMHRARGWGLSKVWALGTLQACDRDGTKHRGGDLRECGAGDSAEHVSWFYMG